MAFEHLHSYPKVYAIGHGAIAELFDGDVLVEEKVDGSQFSFGLFKGQVSMRSRGASIIPGSADSGMGDSYHGSWGNSGSRPELDGKTQNQREKNVNYFNRGGWDERRDRPPSSYRINGLKPKDLVGIPWMLAFALRADGWYLRSDIIWAKPNPMPESVTDRPTKAHEYIFLLSKSERYYYDATAIAERTESIQGARPFGGAGNGKQNKDRNDYMYEGDSGFRNKRTVWSVNPQPFPEAHFATFPEELIKPCILAGCPVGGTVLDPFAGSGTTVLVARELQCKGVGLELNPAYIEIAKRRLAQEVLEFKP